MQVFLSYADEDRARVTAAAAILAEDESLEVWLDTRLERGEWTPQIEREIKKSSVMLLFYSENVTTERFVAKEFKLAKANGVSILPVFMSAESFGRADAFLYLEIQGLQGVQWYEGSFRKVLPKVMNMISDLIPPEASPTNGAPIRAVQQTVPPTRVEKLVKTTVEDVHDFCKDGGQFDEDTGVLIRDPGHMSFMLGPGAIQTCQDDGQDGLEDIWWDDSVETKAARAVPDSDIVEFVQRLKAECGDGRNLISKPSSSEAVAKLRTKLLVLVFTCTTEFLRSYARETTPITSWERHSMDASGGLLETLRDAEDAAEGAGGSADVLLGASSISDRLGKLHAQISKSGVSGDVVGWLTDLFRHSMLFDSPIYPRVEELSLQVSLTQGGITTPVRRLPPVMAVHRKGAGALALAAGAALRRGFTPNESSQRRRFFGSVATVLRLEHERWRRRHAGKGGALFPLALVTNLDLELERALAASDDPDGHYHVAIPVYIERLTETPPHVEIRWLVGDFKTADPEDLDALARPAGPWRTLRSIGNDRGIARQLKGPLVIKLSGSPLHDLPTDPEKTDGRFHLPDLGIAERRSVSGGPANEGPLLRLRRERLEKVETALPRVLIKHALSLGEVDFMQVIRMTSWSFDSVEGDGENARVEGLPGWLCEALKEQKRYWLLAGCRTADWDRRTQIYTLLSQRLAGKGAFVACRQVRDLSRFLSYLGIRRVSGYCHDLTPALERIATCLKESPVTL